MDDNITGDFGSDDDDDNSPFIRKSRSEKLRIMKEREAKRLKRLTTSTNSYIVPEYNKRQSKKTWDLQFVVQGTKHEQKKTADECYNVSPSCPSDQETNASLDHLLQDPRVSACVSYDVYIHCNNRSFYCHNKRYSSYCIKADYIT